MEHFACINEHCRCLIYLGNELRRDCPVCNGTGRPIEAMMIDDLIGALERGFISTEQLKLAFDGPTAPELRRRVEAQNESAKR